MMDWGDSGWSWWWMLTLMTSMMVIIGGIVFAIIALARPTSSTSNGPSAEEILNERFARGEIDGTEYKERVGVLHGKT